MLTSSTDTSPTIYIIVYHNYSVAFSYMNFYTITSVAQRDLVDDYKVAYVLITYVPDRRL